MLTRSQLEQFIEVNPETGGVFRKTKQGLVLAGTLTDNGYLKISFGPRGNIFRPRVHHVVWCWVHGYWPKELDHINGNRKDNRINNLREVTRAQNLTNKVRQSNNKSGFKWVSWCKQRQKWTAEISPPKSLGRRSRLHQSFHDTAEEAYAVACEAAKKYHQQFYNAGG